MGNAELGAAEPRTIMMREALNEALREEMQRDPTVFVLGEGVAERGGSYKVTVGLLEEFGPLRVIDTPISEASFTGAGVGAAVTGMRPVVEGIADGMALAVCSTSNERAVNLLVQKLLGPERKAKFAAILAGDVVSEKKPAPEIYNLAKERLGRQPAECVVVEDNRNGLLAARAAGMHCIITTNSYTKNEDFAEADAVFPELGDPPDVRVTLEDLKGLVTESE